MSTSPKSLKIQTELADRELNPAHYLHNAKICSKCKTEKILLDFYPSRNICNNCTSFASSHPSDPAKIAWQHKKSTAKKLNIPFTLTLEQFKSLNNTHCEVFNTPISHQPNSPNDNSASLDRMIPELGYIYENCHLISNRANTIKNNGKAWEHLLIVIYMIKPYLSHHPHLLTLSNILLTATNFLKSNNI